MNKHVLLSSAIAGLIAAASTGAIASDTYQVAQADQEKCYGIAKKGANDCANIAGTHSCAGNAKTDNHAGEWKYAANGTCKTMRGMSADEAKMKAANK